MASSSDMQTSGVAFVVDGLDSFLDGMQSARKESGALNLALSGLESLGNVGKVLSGIGLAISAIAPEIGPVVAIVGILITAFAKFGEAIGGAIGKVMQFISSALNALASALDKVLGPLIRFVKNVADALNPIKALADFLDRIAYISLGILAADVFRSISRGIKGMAKDALDAASQFQLLRLRLQGLFARDMIEEMYRSETGVINYGKAFDLAAQKASDAYEWIVKLAVTTPFTVESLSNVYTLAKSYGLATDMIERLVPAIGNFTAAMGLSDVVMERIITNFGQMIQQGKITGTEMRDLSRGAFVPIVSIMTEMGDALGFTTEKITEMAKSTKLQEAIFKDMQKTTGKTAEELEHLADVGKLDVMTFIDSFINIVERDFPDAMIRASKTFQGLMGNLKDALQVMLGYKVLGPMFDYITEKLSVLVADVLADERFVKIIDEIGEGLRKWTEAFWPENISGESIVDMIVKGYGKIKSIMESFSTGDWEGAFQKLGIPEWVIQSINDFSATFENIVTFFDQNGDFLLESLDKIAEGFGMKGFQPSDLFTSFAKSLLNFSQWIIDNQDEIVETIDNIAEALAHIGNTTLPILLGGEGSGKEGDLTFLDDVALKVHNLVDDFREFMDKAKVVSDILSGELGPAYERLGSAIGRIREALGIEGGGGGTMDGLFGIIVANGTIIATSINSVAIYLEAVATALENIMLVKDGFLAIIAGVQTLANIDTWTDLLVGITQLMTGISDIFKVNFGDGNVTFEIIQNFVQGIIDLFENLREVLVGHSIIPDMLDDILKAFDEQLHETIDFIASLWSEFYDVGHDIASGFAKGLISRLKQAVEQAKRLVAQLISLMRQAAAAHSPSQETIELGRDIMEGLAIGMERGSKRVFDAADKAMKYTMEPITKSVETTNTSIVNNNINLNANYAETQSPVMVKHDLDAILAMSRN